MELINEVICCDLGRALFLPIPPGIIVTRETDKVRHYASLNFAQAGQALPPANASALADKYPQLACGIILFDLWVANSDRHDKNLSYDEVATAVQLFDHGRALFCGTAGRQRLETVDNQDIINQHCLTGEVTTLDGIKQWADKIRSIPKFFIRDTVMDTKKIGLSDDDAKFCVDFLLRRRSALLRIVKKYRSEFFNAPLTLPGMS